MKTSVGAGLRVLPFRSLPVVSELEDHLQRALKVSYRASVDTKLQRGKSFNDVHRAKHMKQVQRLAGFLDKRLKSWTGKYEARSRLNPYEQAVVDLTLQREGLDRYGGYEGILGSVLQLTKKINNVSDSRVAAMRNVPSRKEVEAQHEQAFQVIEKLYRKHFPDLTRLGQMGKVLKALQVPDANLPTVLLAGAPNVGKSSLVREFSTGMPEVNTYPFTTRSVIVGHFERDGTVYQMTDTPGLLYREEDERNDIERLAIASLEYLRSVVVFVVDLTEDCGTSVEDQLALRDTVRGKYNGEDRPWIDVMSKRDLGENFRKQSLYQHAVARALGVSVVSKEGLDQLRSQFVADLMRISTPTVETVAPRAQDVGSAGKG